MALQSLLKEPIQGEIIDRSNGVEAHIFNYSNLEAEIDLCEFEASYSIEQVPGMSGLQKKKIPVLLPYKHI